MAVTKTKLVVVVPTIREACHAAFVKAWAPLFEKHSVTLVTVWDGDDPYVTRTDFGHDMRSTSGPYPLSQTDLLGGHTDLICRRTDACRNYGFLHAAEYLNPTHVLTMDDDCYPPPHPHQDVDTYFADGDPVYDPVQAHLDALDRRVPLGWMNTVHDTDLYLRGVPYGIRSEAPVMLSHGVWVGTPDFDGETQLRLESEGETKDGRVVRYKGVPHSLPYYVGPIPRGVLFPLSGMNVMVRAEALPYLYFSPMGADSGVPNLHRFADIWMGISLQKKFGQLGWGCVSGYSTVLHTRASDAKINFEQEKLGREWNEFMYLNNDQWEIPQELPAGMREYCRSYADKRRRYATLIKNLLEKK